MRDRPIRYMEPPNNFIFDCIGLNKKNKKCLPSALKLQKKKIVILYIIIASYNIMRLLQFLGSTSTCRMTSRRKMASRKG